jgi:spermidine/putrescine transport system substrate-binding protein
VIPVTPGQDQLTRRRFLHRAGLGAGLGAAVLAGGLGGCAGAGLAPVPLPSSVPDRSGTRPLVRFANWVDYVDTTPTGQHPTLAEFTRRTGIRVDYSEPITSDQQFYGQIGIPLALGQDPGYDLVVFADWMAAQLIGLRWVEPLAPELLPNAWRVLPQFRNLPLPDMRRYSLPWQAGFTGIGYNVRATRRPVTSMTDLLTTPDLRGRVSLVTDMRDVMGLVLLEQGSDPAAFTAAEFSAALAVLSRSVNAGQIRAVTSYYVPGLTKGAIAAGVVYAGDILEVQQASPWLRFAWPQYGGMLWTDNMVIPARARYRANAERLMNFYYQPPVAAQLSAYEQYVCPVLGTQAVMRPLEPALAGNQFIFPSPALLASSHRFMLLSQAQSADYTARFEQVVGL